MIKYVGTHITTDNVELEKLLRGNHYQNHLRRVIDMSIDEAIAKHRKIAKTQKALYDACTLKEQNKHFLREAEEHEQLANWLEELVMLRFDSCMIHMSERLQLVENGYNNALNDFVNACEKQFTTIYRQRYVDMRDIVNIAEQLKAGTKI